jgi:hypothetical protein
MKKALYVFHGLLIALTLLLVTALPAYAQQKPQWRSSLPSHHQVSTTPAKGIAAQKTALFKRLHQKSTIRYSTSYQTFPSWSGYIVGDGNNQGYKGVEANWSGPCKTGTVNSQIQYGTWVGLGGVFKNEPLEQAGLILQSDGTYRLFWEYISVNQPPYIDKNDVIHCGDSITAWVHFGSSYCSNGGFYAHVQDNKTGAHLGSTCLTESQGLGTLSAEWIDERPLLTSCYNPAQLADFVTSNWSNVLAQANFGSASWLNPNNFPNTQELMYEQSTGIYLAYPDGLQVNSNNTFTDRWYAYGTYCYGGN